MESVLGFVTVSTRGGSAVVVSVPMTALVPVPGSAFAPDTLTPGNAAKDIIVQITKRLGLAFVDRHGCAGSLGSLAPEAAPTQAGQGCVANRRRVVLRLGL